MDISEKELTNRISGLNPRRGEVYRLEIDDSQGYEQKGDEEGMQADFVGEEEEDKPVEGAKRNEKHTCPSCKKVYNVAIMDHTEENDTFEVPYHFITHHKSNFRGQSAGGMGFAIAVNQKQLSLTDLQECKKEILAIPPVDDMVACKAFSYKEEDNYELEGRGCPYKA
ncbi:11321_t:CDS:2, partial [Funneliformis geosporum]